MVVVVPFALSRAMSPLRRVVVHEIAGVDRSEDAATGATLRLAAYNIAHGRGLADSNWDTGPPSERISRLDDIARLLRTIDADIVVLNEVDFDCSWSRSVNQALYLAEHAGYRFRAEQRNLDVRFAFWTWRFGNAILSKYPITRAQVVDLPGYSRWETLVAGKKKGLMCEIQWADQPVRVIGAHLSHRSESLRVQSVSDIVDLMAEQQGIPTILAGDLNSTPSGYPHSKQDVTGANAIDLLDRSAFFRRSPDGAHTTDASFTFPAVRPDRVIDWIMIPPAWQFVEYDVDPSQHSDHRAVLSSIKPKAPDAR